MTQTILFDPLLPWPVIWALRLSRLLPDALWDLMVGGRRHKALPPS